MGLGADLMVRALSALGRNSLDFQRQPVEGVTYARKITNDEARIDWSAPAKAVHDQVRGLSPAPGAFFETGGRERIKVFRTALAEGSGAPGTLLDGSGAVACGSGAVRLLQLRPAGKPTMTAAEFLRGRRLAAGATLS
jgi:methionyl-tRNA formyltransferase